MKLLRSNAVRLCLSMVLSAGIVMLLLSQLLLTVMPYVRLDAMLTRQQLADPAYREATLAELQSAQEELLLISTRTSLLVMVLSAAGLYFGRAGKVLTDRVSGDRGMAVK
jgi:hypothetical protein